MAKTQLLETPSASGAAEDVLFQQMASPAIILDSHFRVLKMNECAERALRTKSTEVLGLACLSFIRRENRCEFIKKIKSSQLGGKWELSLKIQPKTGDFFSAICQIFFCRNTESPQDSYLILLWPQTEDLSLSEALRPDVRRAREEFYAILDRITDGFFAVDRNWTVLYGNRETERLAGLPREVFVGKNMWELAPDYLGPKVYQHYQRAMQTSEPTEFEVYFANLQAWFHTKIYPSDEGLSIFFRNITDQKVAEQKVLQISADLLRSNKDLEQFAAIASHDLKEPLRMISLYLELLDQRYRADLDRTAISYLDHAVGSSRRLISLIDDLLTYSSAGREDRALVPVHLERVLHVVESNLEISIKESRAKIVTPVALPEILGDETQLTQLFQNLISNALKFRTATRPTIIEINSRNEGDHYLLSVKDNGIGIEPKFNNRIFQIFRRLHSQEEYPGAGIGLAIAKKIVERHGGKIWVDSEKDIGTTFFFTLKKVLR